MWTTWCAAIALYALVLAPAPYLLDSAELAAAAFGLGVAHPPGEAVALLWGKLFCFLPLGSVAFRVGLSQAVAGAIAVALVFRIALALVAGRAPGALGPRAEAALAGAAALAFGLAPGAIIVANRPEVYALQTALSLGAVLLALEAATRRDPRLALVAGLLVGLGIANHPLVAGLVAAGALVPAAALLVAPGAPRVRLVAWAIAAFVVGAAAVVYVPLRAAALFAEAPRNVATLAWGDARSVAGLWWVLSAKTFADKTGVVHAEADPTSLPFAFFEELGLLLPLLAALGAALLARGRGTRLAAVALVAAGAGAAAAALTGGFEPSNPDMRGYLGVALAVVATLSAAGLAPLVAALPGPALRSGATAVVLAGVVASGVRAGRDVDLRGARAAAALAEALLTELPPRAALLTSYFQTAFLVAYLRGVEGQRPDVAHAHLGFARGPGYAARLAAAEPALTPILAAHAAGALGPGPLAALDEARPPRMEPDLHLDPALRARLLPAGATWRLAGADAEAARDARLAPLPPRVFVEARRDREVRGYAAYRAFMDAALACERGLGAAAALRLDELARLVPEDRDRALLDDRCRRRVAPPPR
jgi:hypothetical protein